MSDSTHTILHSAKRFLSGTLLSRITGMLRDISMAYIFGASASIASFMVAFRLAHLLRRLFGEGALQSAFIPEFEHLRHQDEKKAFAFFRDLVVFMSLALSLVIFISASALTAALLWLELSPPNYEIVFLTLLMLPSLLFICLYGINASFLQCEKCYFTSSVAPVAFNLIWIGAVFALKSWSPAEAMPVLAVAVIAACFFQWLWTVPKTVSLLKNELKHSLGKNLLGQWKAIVHLGRPLTLGILGVAASQINSAVDTLFARYAELTGPALLWYAIRLQQLPLALFSIAIAGAILPPLSRAIKAQDWQKYSHFLQQALIATCALMLPITAIIFCMGESCVNLVYGHGDFKELEVWQTTYCLWAYGMGLIPSALVLILASSFYAQQNYFLPAAASFFTMILNLALNSLFIFGLGWGASSVALATSISAWLNLFGLSTYLVSYGHLVINREVLQILAKILVSTLTAFFITLFIRNLIEQIPLFSFYNLHLTHSFPQQLFQFIYQFTIFVLICLLSCYSFNLNKAQLLNFQIKN